MPATTKAKVRLEAMDNDTAKASSICATKGAKNARPKVSGAKSTLISFSIILSPGLSLDLSLGLSPALSVSARSLELYFLKL
jgi:hypothetical protein